MQSHAATQGNRDHVILDVTPLLVEAHKDYGTTPLHSASVKSSSNYIQASLKNIKKYKRTYGVRLSATNISTVLAVLGLYAAYVYAAYRFFHQEQPTLQRYKMTHANGTVTCGELYPVEHDISYYIYNYALGCANHLNEYYVSWIMKDIGDFKANCYQFYPNIDFNNVTALNEVSAPTCYAFASEIIRGTSDMYYDFAAGILNRCNASFPIMNFNISIGMQNLYNVVPFLGVCYEKAEKEREHFWKADDPWISPTRSGLIALGVFIGLGLIVMTLYVYRFMRYINREARFDDLPADQRSAINELITRFDDDKTAIHPARKLEKVQHRIEQNNQNNDARLDKATAFLEATSTQGFELFAARDQNLDMRLSILNEAKLLR